MVEQKRRNIIFSFKDDDRTLRHILIARKTNESSQTAQNTKNHGSLKTSKNEDIENLGKSLNHKWVLNFVKGFFYIY